ncbi:hypothetical protein NZD89_28055 (plasmid) [Alicyclobacillus fastidiosus]|uniref:Uncharacterized protein n=1 Tax=Alicyclobacillus fastidiosus TaxID=392011 RepID=A0ABY6ZQ04_9BACL|nr:hypothetical protein [Alicyclobacillus fastidiosus]WAH44904.1 hypothetical protein NZD89_28055 [Alicyclobacillus fastidiosus]GMA65663.1 hypothetical protein GCM10025859_61030 [Alicyclobacillus fastidiosus]
MKWWIGALAITICVTGCGTTQVHQASVKTIQTTLPKSVEVSLSAPTTRLHKVTKLPITQIGVHNLKGQINILYIAPDEVYAINQFRSVWNQLKVKPTVVWTKTESTNAKQLWSKEGYKGDPIPSTHTYFSLSAPPTPDAYHKVGTDAWNDEPGIMPDSDVGYWGKFFN